MDLTPSEDPALKKCSSETSDLGPSLPLSRPTLGGGVTKIFLPKVEPLEIVTGEPPNRPWAPLARLTADLNASSKSVMEPLRLIELPRLGVITRGSPR